MSRSALRNGLAAQLDSQIADLQGHGYAPRQLNPPAAVVIGLDQQPGTFGTSFATYTWEATVRLLVAGDIGHATQRLDDLAEQIEPAINADPTLGGTVDDASWIRTRGDSEGIVEVQGVTLYALDVDVRITG